MTQPEQSPQVFEGVDVEVGPDDLDEPVEAPATTDPSQSTDDGDLGGVGGEGAGGAG